MYSFDYVLMRLTRLTRLVRLINIFWPRHLSIPSMVSFHLKLKPPKKYINTNTNIKVLRVHLNCKRTITFKRKESLKISITFKPEIFRLLLVMIVYKS